MRKITIALATGLAALVTGLGIQVSATGTVPTGLLQSVNGWCVVGTTSESYASQTCDQGTPAERWQASLDGPGLVSTDGTCLAAKADGSFLDAACGSTGTNWEFHAWNGRIVSLDQPGMCLTAGRTFTPPRRASSQLAEPLSLTACGSSPADQHWTFLVRA